MKVYKFGGASVSTKAGVENVCHLLSLERGPVFVVVSAMGKTTNALEEVLELTTRGQRAEALACFAGIEAQHREIATALLSDQAASQSALLSALLAHLGGYCDQVRTVISEAGEQDDYDRLYDRVVGYGELLSTLIVSDYLAFRGFANRWVDMRQVFVTNDRHREATIDVDRSGALLRAEVEAAESCRLFIGQGFIGACEDGTPTTLGREGSDYSAAMVGYLLEAESVTIWKDVEGILNADPRLFPDPVFLPQLTYLDAIELAYSGAQVIHPKTIKPLQNKQIPLYVRPFSDPSKPGTVICQTMDVPIGVPIYILKQNQVLVSIRPNDFSFVLEERLSDIFAIFTRFRQKINLIQSSAVNLSVCVDDSRRLPEVVDALQPDFRVVYNKSVELLTVRGYDSSACTCYAEGPKILLTQKTRRTLRVVRRV